MIADERYYTLINKYLNLSELLPEYFLDFGCESFTNEQNIEHTLLSYAIFIHFVENLPNDKFYTYINEQISVKLQQIANQKNRKVYGSDIELYSFVDSHFDKSVDGYYSNFNKLINAEEVLGMMVTSFTLMSEKENIFFGLSSDILKKRLNKYRTDLQKCVSPNSNDLPFYILNSLFKLPTKTFIDRLFAKKKTINLKLLLNKILTESYENCIDCYLHLVLSYSPPWIEIVHKEPEFRDWCEPSVPSLTYDEEQLYEIIKRHINVRKSLIQNRFYAKSIISDKTETEIAIFSCAVLIFHKSSNQNDFYSEIEKGMISILMNMAYRHRLWNYVDEKFIQKRVVEYHEDIKQCLSDEPTELPYRSYYYLFGEPLTKEFIQQDFNDSEVTKFRGLLKEIVHVHNEVFKRICLDFFMYKKKF